MEKEKVEFISCECGTHVLRVGHISELYDETNAVTSAPRIRQEIELAMFSYGRYSGNLTFKDKCKIIWKLITKGKMWEDEIILNEDEARKLSGFINDSLIPTEKEKTE